MDLHKIVAKALRIARKKYPGFGVVELTFDFDEYLTRNPSMVKYRGLLAGAHHVDSGLIFIDPEPESYYHNYQRAAKLDTVLHELAHLILQRKTKSIEADFHNAQWREIATNLGCVPKEDTSLDNLRKLYNNTKRS
jgi:predicted SprT family Zn-dependent metalloprotease